MFLRQQFYFYKIYFRLADFFKLLPITWDSSQNIFKLKNAKLRRLLIRILLASNFLYMIRATFVFAVVASNTHNSPGFLVNIVFHILGLGVSLYLLLYRCLYTFTVHDIIQLMHAMIKLEDDKLCSKFYLNSCTY